MARQNTDLDAISMVFPIKYRDMGFPLGFVLTLFRHVSCGALLCCAFRGPKGQQKSTGGRNGSNPTSAFHLDTKQKRGNQKVVFKSSLYKCSNLEKQESFQ